MTPLGGIERKSSTDSPNGRSTWRRAVPVGLLVLILVVGYALAGHGPLVFTTHEIATNANAAASVATADVDGDGDMDVLSASHDDHTVA